MSHNITTMNFIQNLVKNTVTNVETLSEKAKAAVNTLNPGSASDSPWATSPTEAEAGGEACDNVLAKESRTSVASVGGAVGEDVAESTVPGDEEVDENGKAAFINPQEVSQKALDGAKSFGNFLFNVANKAGQTVQATAKQIKSTVESVGLMQEFTKEQQEFIKEHGGNTELAQPPWVGCAEEEKVKEEILGLSQDKRNFVRCPPAGVQFEFDMDSIFGVALALLKEDPELGKMRYELVPKMVNEETFWRNYFYRVSLIKQNPDFTTGSCDETAGAGKASWASSRSSSSEGPDEPATSGVDASESEYISDSAYKAASGVSMDDIRKDMAKLGITKDEFDVQLAKDLQEFEVVGSSDKVDDDEINRELENFDLK